MAGDAHNSPPARMSTAADILAAIAADRDVLRRLGVLDIALFGSFARGEQTEESDVDLLVELTDAKFDRYMDVKEHLTELLGRDVDLVVSDALKPRLRQVILAEAVRPDIDAAWFAEVERRCAGLDAGTAVTSDWDEVRRRIGVC